MADRRKLQGEVDRCLKKVTEGCEIFEDIWKKVQNATNINQKEKYESELKKEIKKLQRLREQIKTWAASSDIKDKKSLLDNRKLIELQMERFRVVEKETKTKAYSKEGLGQANKVDPETKEKEKCREWLNDFIGTLGIQVDQMESEIELVSASTKKKKLDKDKVERIDELHQRIEKHTFHTTQLEHILRLLDNQTIEVDEVNKIKDDIDYYIENNQEQEIDEMDLEGIYEDLDLDALIGAEILKNPDDKDEEDSIQSSPSSSLTSSHFHSISSPAKSTTSASPRKNSKSSSSSVPSTPSLSNGGGGSSTSLSSSSTTISTITPSHTPSKRNLFTSQSSTSSTTGKDTTTGSNSGSFSSSSSVDSTDTTSSLTNTPSIPLVNGFAHVDTTSNNTTNATITSSESDLSIATKPSSIDNNTGTASSSPSSSSTTTEQQQQQQHNNTAVDPSGGISPALTSSTTTASLESSIDLALLSNTTTTTGVSSTGGIISRPGVLPTEEETAAVQAVRNHVESLKHPGNSATSWRGSTTASPAPLGLDTLAGSGPTAANASVATIVADTNVVSATGTSSVATVDTTSVLGGIEPIGSTSPSQQQATSNNTLPYPASSKMEETLGSQLAATTTSTSSSAATDFANLKSSSLFGSVMSNTAAPGLGPKLPNVNSSSTVPGTTTTTTSETQEVRLQPVHGVAPLGPVLLTQERVKQLKMLDGAYHHLPQRQDSEKMRPYISRSAVPIASYHHHPPPPNIDSLEFFQRLSTETLFFIFYYQEGTRAQYLAAKALKKQSWRFHTKYMMWFQRHEEPKRITDEYEEGTYIFFDYEKWSQRKRDSFTFEYRYLEDKELP